MRILVVEDNISNKMLIRRVLKKENLQVDISSNGIEAFQLLKQNEYNLVITDWMMPKMNGLELVKKIREKIISSPRIIMLTALASTEAEDQAMAAGVDLFITKPYDTKYLVEKVKDLLENKVDEHFVRTINLKSPTVKIRYKGVSIAASTGGPPTLTKIFTELNSTRQAAFFVCLHGPDWMLEAFAEKLNDQSQIEVRLGENDMPIQPGFAYLAPGNLHMIVDHKEMTIKLLDTEPENFVKPSADPLFKTVAQTFKDNSLGVVLTGMGRDGTVGAGYIKAAGGQIITENPETAILHAMPKSVIDLDLSDKTLDADKIAAEINFRLAK